MTRYKCSPSANISSRCMILGCLNVRNISASFVISVVVVVASCFPWCDKDEDDDDAYCLILIRFTAQFIPFSLLIA